jgi:hypothetical protein
VVVMPAFEPASALLFRGDFFALLDRILCNEKKVGRIFRGES